MKKALNVIALVAALLSAAFWLVKGADRGWTKTSAAIKTLDPVTGIEAIDYRKTFIPGVDFLAVSWLASGTLSLASFLIPKQNK